MLNSFGRILIWLGVAAFVAPLIMSLVMMVKATSAINKAFNKIDEDEAVASNLSSFEIKRRTRALKALLAPQGAVSGAAASLTFVVTTFDMRNRERIQQAQDVAKSAEASQTAVNAALSAPLDLAIDYGDATRRALVLLSNDSVAIDIAATNPASAIGVLAVETKAFPDVSKLKAGMLAGYKVEAAGSARTAQPIDLLDAEYTERAELCRSIKSWTRHFGLTSEKVDFVVFADPTQLSYDGSKWVSDGREGTRLFDTEIVTLCE